MPSWAGKWVFLSKPWGWEALMWTLDSPCCGTETKGEKKLQAEIPSSTSYLTLHPGLFELELSEQSHLRKEGSNVLSRSDFKWPLSSSHQLVERTLNCSFQQKIKEEKFTMPFGLSRLWLLHCHHSSKHVFPLSVFFSELSMAFFVILICSLYLLCSCKMARAKARNLSVSVSFSSQKKKDQNKFKKHKITTKQTPNKQKTPPSTKPSPTTEIKQQWFLVFAALSLLLKIKITVGSRLKEYISLKEKIFDFFGFWLPCIRSTNLIYDWHKLPATVEELPKTET